MCTLLVNDIKSQPEEEINELSKNEQKMTIGGWRIYHWFDWWARFE